LISYITSLSLLGFWGVMKLFSFRILVMPNGCLKEEITQLCGVFIEQGVRSTSSKITSSVSIVKLLWMSFGLWMTFFQTQHSRRSCRIFYIHTTFVMHALVRFLSFYPSSGFVEISEQTLSCYITEISASLQRSKQHFVKYR
jgi:hypothetical protein